MFKVFVAAFKEVLKKYRIEALNKEIQAAGRVREKAKQIALKAQAKRDALLAE